MEMEEKMKKIIIMNIIMLLAMNSLHSAGCAKGSDSKKGKQRRISSVSPFSNDSGVVSPADLKEQRALIEEISAIEASSAAGEGAQREDVPDWLRRQPVTDWPLQQAKMGLPTNVYIPEVHRERALRVIRDDNPQSIRELMDMVNALYIQEQQEMEALASELAPVELDENLLRELGFEKQ